MNADFQAVLDAQQAATSEIAKSALTIQANNALLNAVIDKLNALAQLGGNVSAQDLQNLAASIKAGQDALQGSDDSLSAADVAAAAALAALDPPVPPVVE